MTKLEKLKAALAAATPGQWAVKQEREYKACNSRVLCDKGYTVAQGYSSDSATTKTYNELWAEAEGNTNFIALAHNLMPQLLEAVEVLKAVVPLMDIAFNYDGDVFGRQHNNATDVYSAAECVLGELE